MKFTLITCSGVSNTGKLTTQTGATLIYRSSNTIEACVPATRPSIILKNTIEHADQILVLDGCADCCGKKKVQALGIEPHLHIIATECGIEKKGMAEPRFDEIERFSVAVLEMIRQ